MLPCTSSTPGGALRPPWAVLTGIGLVWEITAAWVVLEIVVVTTALEVGYFANLLMEGLVEGLAIRPN